MDRRYESLVRTGCTIHVNSSWRCHRPQNPDPKLGNPHGIVAIHISVRKYGSQVIAMCHHPALSPMATMPRSATPATAAPTKAPAMRRGVARVCARSRPGRHCSGLRFLDWFRLSRRLGRRCGPLGPGSRALRQFGLSGRGAVSWRQVGQKQKSPPSLMAVSLSFVSRTVNGMPPSAATSSPY